jgi:hypothetical protein
MTNAEIKAEEFDFAENLAMFEKRKFKLGLCYVLLWRTGSSTYTLGKPAIIFVNFLVPVSSSKPTLAAHQKNPSFCPSDTTFLAERTIDSIKLNGMKPEKVFVTDTGVQIPAVTLATRNTILNSAHNYGLSHDRFVTLCIWALNYDILTVELAVSPFYEP